MSSAVQNRQPWLAHGYPGMRSPTPSGAPRQTWTDDCDKSLDDSFPLRYRLQTQTSADIYHLEHINALLQVVKNFKNLKYLAEKWKPASENLTFKFNLFICFPHFFFNFAFSFVLAVNVLYTLILPMVAVALIRTAQS